MTPAISKAKTTTFRLDLKEGFFWRSFGGTQSKLFEMAVLTLKRSVSRAMEFGVRWVVVGIGWVGLYMERF